MTLRPGDLLRRLPASALHFFVLGMALSVAFVMGNTVGTGLVLGDGGAERLPVLYVLFPVLSVPAAFALSALIDRGSQIRLFQLELGGCGAALLVLWVLLEAGLGLARDGIYLVTKVHEVLADILFWTVVMQYATSLELKRYATALGVGFALGGVIGGGFAALLVELVSPPALLFVCIALYALVALYLQAIGLSCSRSAAAGTTGTTNRGRASSHRSGPCPPSSGATPWPCGYALACC